MAQMVDWSRVSQGLPQLGNGQSAGSFNNFGTAPTSMPTRTAPAGSGFNLGGGQWPTSPAPTSMPTRTAPAGSGFNLGGGQWPTAPRPMLGNPAMPFLNGQPANQPGNFVSDPFFTGARSTAAGAAADDAAWRAANPNGQQGQIGGFLGSMFGGGQSGGGTAWAGGSPNFNEMGGQYNPAGGSGFNLGGGQWPQQIGGRPTTSPIGPRPMLNQTPYGGGSLGGLLRYRAM